MSKFERVLRNVAYFLLGVLLTALALAARDAHAAKPDRQLVFQDVTLILQDKPCEIGAIIANIDPAIRSEVKGGFVVPHAKGEAPYKLCYLDDGEQVGVADEYGRKGLFPSEVFLPVGVQRQKRVPSPVI